MNERVSDLWPEDPRWGEAYVKPPLGGVADEAYEREVQSYIEKVKLLVAQFEEKYPGHPWWTPAYVNEYPELALLLQAINQELIFASMASFTDLRDRIAGDSLIPEEDLSVPAEVRAARLALGAVLQSPQSGEMLNLADKIMTEGDKLELALLLRGVGRVVVQEA